MRSIYLRSHGEPNSVKIGEQPKPTPAKNQVRVRIEVAAFNHVDLYMRRSGEGITHQLPLILGVDGAGLVDALGPGVTEWRAGDRVVIYPAKTCGHCEYCRRGEQMLCLSCKVLGEHVHGTFAEFVCVDATMLFAVPPTVNFETAAVLPCAYLTAWRMVMTQARIRPSDTVLIHGIGGGVALASLQMTKLAGGRAIVTSSSAGKVQRALEIGADAAIDHGRDNVLEAVLRFTDGRGVDVVIDNVGQATWPTSLRAVRRGGRIVTCGATTGPHPKADLQRIFIRQLQIFGSTLGTHDEFRALLSAVANQQIVPVIDRVFTFGGVHEALNDLDHARQFGKMALRITDAARPASSSDSSPVGL